MRRGRDSKTIAATGVGGSSDERSSEKQADSARPASEIISGELGSTPVSEPERADHGGDAIEAALVTALTAATTAGRFDVVSQIAREIEARRAARAGNVVALDARVKRGKGGR